MTRQNINTGSSANDGTGDTLRTAGGKINDNFIELYNFLGAEGDSSTLATKVKLQDSSVLFEGDTLNAFETRLIAEDPTADRIVTIPNATGTVVFKDTTDTLTNKTINGPDNTITNIGNSSLSNSSITISDGSNTSPISLGGTLTLAGTANEVEVVENAGTVTIGMPDNVVITGNLTVNGTTTTVNSTTIEVTNSFTFEGTTSDDFETTLTVIDPTADRTVSLPNATGTVVLEDNSVTLTNKTLSNASITGSTGIINLTSQENKIRFNYNGTSNFPTAATYEGLFVFDKTAGQKKPYVASASGYINILTENDTIDRFSNVNTTGVSDGDGLIFSSAQGRFNVGALPSTGFSIAMAVAL